MPQNDIYTEPAPKPADIPLRIYSNPICPYAQRVRLIAAAKKVKTQEVDIHLKVKPDWYLEKINPEGKVPTIEHNGHLIRESLIAFDYIDEVFGGKSLWPTDPYQKAVQQLLVNDFGNKVTSHYYKLYKEESEAAVLEIKKFVTTRLEELLKTQKFLAGEEQGAVDLLIWPWLERFGVMKQRVPIAATLLSDEEFPELKRYIAAMKETDAVKDSLLSDEAHLGFINSFKSGTGNHDYSFADRTGKGLDIYTKKA